MVYPRGGWLRAMQYTLHRLRRLPDAPHRIGRGIAAGAFMSFTPLFGLHLFGSMALAWAIGGNVLAGVIGSFVGNPVTIPFIALLSMAIGRWMLGIEGSLTPIALFDAFSAAGRQLMANALALWNGAAMEWDQLAAFGRDIFLPYLLGGIGPGLLVAAACHYLTVPLVRAYHTRRSAALARRTALRAGAAAEEGAADTRHAPRP